MKKMILLCFGVVALAGCYSSDNAGKVYDYYKSNVKYHQSGSDCIYYINEHGRHFNKEDNSLRNAKRVVYPNTQCSDLYAKNNFDVIDASQGQTIKIIKTHKKPHSCGCSNCCRNMKLKRRYILK